MVLMHDIKDYTASAIEDIIKYGKKYAQNLNEKINQELIDLEMKNAKINVKVDYKANEFFEDGKVINYQKKLSENIVNFEKGRSVF